MCLAIPMEITELKENGMATVSASGATRDIALDLTPDAKVGDFVLVHAGFSIEVVSPEFAEETLSLIQEMADMVDDPLFNPAEAEEVCTLPHAEASATSACAAGVSPVGAVAAPAGVSFSVTTVSSTDAAEAATAATEA